MLSSLKQIILERNDKSLAQALNEFVDLYYAEIPDDEIMLHSTEDLYGATLSCWKFIQERKKNEIKIRVFNPDYENHGWRSSHTIVEILTPDIPFLVDSVRMFVNSQNMAIHAIQYAVINVKRDAKHKIKNANLKQQDSQLTAESIIHVEVDLHTNKQVLDGLNAQLQEIMQEVSFCVEDYDNIHKKVEQAITYVNKGCQLRPQSERDEVVAFLKWLGDNHFTFLAYDEFSIEQDENTALVKRDVKQDLGLFRLRKASRSKVKLEEMTTDIQEFITQPKLISFIKSGNRSRVHRPAYPNYVVVKRYDDKGNVIGGIRFLGLYTSVVYIETPWNIPIVRQKLQEVREKSGFDFNNHNGKELNRILEVHPREELFQTSVEHLYKTTTGVLNIQERRQTRVYIEQDPYSRFISCLVYSPRDSYNTEVRLKMEQVLQEEFEPLDIEFNTYFSESILNRTHFMLRIDDKVTAEIDVDKVAYRISQAICSWEDNLRDALIESMGEEKGNKSFNQYRHAFPAGYRETFNTRTAVSDIQHINELFTQHEKPLAMSLYRELEDEENILRFKLFQPNHNVHLSDILPVLENLGLRAMGENPYEIVRKDGQVVWIHNFILQYSLAGTINISEVKQAFENAFRAIWIGKGENDAFNRMVLGSNLGWHDVAILRTYARYMKQIRSAMSETYIADTLCRYVHISQYLVEYFGLKFAINKQDMAQRETAMQACEDKILSSLDDVAQLNEDRVIRRYLELMKATLRTNAYQTDTNGEKKNYLAIKLHPEKISNMPLPRPAFEIFVYSPSVEGVHLRGGKVARGGLRWSDRTDDFRTEVLGLVKAQQVKNSVIVPVGAKGGFIAKNLPKSDDREAFMAEGIRSYQTFISALLDVTDNRKDGKVIAPDNVICYDEQDPYLVVAADKGTATFSDIANEIAIARGFWLGDAFASGGSVGYDHKKMGITARGAWISVQRHFREMGHNVQEQDFNVVGIGDMAGDVFGNGMLLSKHICLVAAFNHMHIFIDPTPNSAESFKERQRLFDMPRSSWADYDKKLISKGGGIFLRSAKSISISPEMRKCFAIKEKHLSPNDLISALLKAPIDLIWNGGIGTYIKASSESNSRVGDKANDALRVNGNEVQAKVIGEGGNLGVTQLGRIEYALHGGKSYTDFIDNSAGVDTSDQEVNIKIMLNDLLLSEDLTEKQRNKIFLSMTEQVSDLVLKHNYRQTQAIKLAYIDCQTRLNEYVRLIRDYESRGRLDRKLEFLPDDESIQERRNNNQGLTRPELSVLISYTKGELKERLNSKTISEDKYLSQMIEQSFPQKLVQDYQQKIYNHRLRGEIIATRLANNVVDYMGITYINRLSDSTGACMEDILRAFIAARDIFSLDEYWQEIESLDYQVATSVQESMMQDMMRLIRRSSRWFVRNRRANLDIGKEVADFKDKVQEIGKKLNQLLTGETLEQYQKQFNERIEKGVPKALANTSSGASNLYSALSIIEAAQQSKRSLTSVSEAYFQVGELLSLNWFMQRINELPTATHWEALARETLRDDLESQQRVLTAALLGHQKAKEKLSDTIERWQNEHKSLFARWHNMLNEAQSMPQIEFSMVSVALRELLDLAQATQHRDLNS